MSRYLINILASRDLNEIADYFAKTNKVTRFCNFLLFSFT